MKRILPVPVAEVCGFRRYDFPELIGAALIVGMMVVERVMIVAMRAFGVRTVVVYVDVVPADMNVKEHAGARRRDGRDEQA